jgi:multidrug efflux pump subunit AcrA (membrane-fusion protein)
LLSGTGCDRRNKSGAPDSAAETVAVARRQFASTVSAVGAVKPQVGAEVKVGARISGRVERLHANIKDQVSKGQVIAELEKADLEATVAQRRAEARLAEAKLAALTELLPKDVAKAEADGARWEASVALARKDMARQRDLLKEKISSQEATDQAQEKLAVAEAQLDAARKTQELVRAQYAENCKQAQAELKRLAADTPAAKPG